MRMKNSTEGCDRNVVDIPHVHLSDRQILSHSHSLVVRTSESSSKPSKRAEKSECADRKTKKTFANHGTTIYIP
jgi:hypothetical protein